MADRPEELELVDRYLATSRNTHLYAFRVQRELVELHVADEHTRMLLADSAAIVLQEMPTLTREWRVLKDEWFETELLDPAGLDRKTQVLKACFAQLGLQLQALVARQDEIVAELTELLDRAQRD